MKRLLLLIVLTAITSPLCAQGLGGGIFGNFTARRIRTLTGAPAAVEGDVYENTTTHDLWFYDGTAFRTLAGSGSSFAVTRAGAVWTSFADTTGTTASYFGSVGSAAEMSVNRSFAATFFDATKAAAFIYMPSATSDAHIEFYTSPTANTTPVLNGFVSANGPSLFGGSVARVTSDFTTAANTSLQTFATLTLPASTPANYPFHCDILYSQATAAVAAQFGIQAATFNPTNITAKADVNISASTFTAGNLRLLATTTATPIVTFTPSAVTTIWNARIAGLIENPSNVSTQVVNFMVQTSVAGDAVTVYKDTVCMVGF